MPTPPSPPLPDDPSPQDGPVRPGSRFLQLTSPKNPVVKWVGEAASGRQSGLLVAEGRQLVREALATEHAMPFAAISSRLLEARDGHDLKRRLEQRADRFAECSDGVFEKMSSLTSPQGVLAVLARPGRPLDALAPAAPAPALVIVAAGVRDPGNLGAVVRTAEAAGADGMVLLRGSADPFRDKAVRGSMGSVLRLPIASGPSGLADGGGGPTGVEVEDLLEWKRAGGFRLLVLDSVVADAARSGPVGVPAQGDDGWLDVDLNGRVAVVLGGEAHGVPDAVREAADHVVRIPMRPPVDSLNVAVAAGVVLYEALRQRGRA